MPHPTSPPNKILHISLQGLSQWACLIIPFKFPPKPSPDLVWVPYPVPGLLWPLLSAPQLTSRLPSGPTLLYLRRPKAPPTAHTTSILRKVLHILLQCLGRWVCLIFPSTLPPQPTNLPPFSRLGPEYTSFDQPSHLCPPDFIPPKLFPAFRLNLPAYP